MPDKKKVLFLLESFNDEVDTVTIVKCIEEGGSIPFLVMDKEQTYNGFDIIIFDIFVWKENNKLEEKLKELINSRAKLICFPSRFVDCPERVMVKIIGYFPNNWSWIEGSESIRSTVEKMAAG